MTITTLEVCKTMRARNRTWSVLPGAAAIAAVAMTLVFGFMHAQQNPAPQSVEAASYPSVEVLVVDHAEKASPN